MGPPVPESRTWVNPPKHLSTEWLSAYLDGVISPQEGDVPPAAEAHLQNCPRCADDLAGLDAVRTLLRRLPQHAPPRSFALQDIPEPRQVGIFRLPRMVAWTRAASAVAAAVFVLCLSLDLLGVGDDVAAPSAVQNRIAAPTVAPASVKAAAPAVAPGPQAATAVIFPPSVAAGDRDRGGLESAGSAETKIGTLSATPANPVTDVIPTYRPLRLASIVAGILALLFLSAALFSGRRAAT